MNEGLVDLLDAAMQQAYDLCGASAALTNPGGVAEDQGVLVSEMPAGRVQARYGRDDVRIADVEFRRAALLVPPVYDAKVVIAAGPQAGTWTVLGTEREDDVVIVVRVRMARRVDAVAPGAKAMRR